MLVDLRKTTTTKKKGNHSVSVIFLFRKFLSRVGAQMLVSLVCLTMLVCFNRRRKVPEPDAPFSTKRCLMWFSEYTGESLGCLLLSQATSCRSVWNVRQPRLWMRFEMEQQIAAPKMPLWTLLTAFYRGWRGHDWTRRHGEILWRHWSWAWKCKQMTITIFFQCPFRSLPEMRWDEVITWQVALWRPCSLSKRADPALLSFHIRPPPTCQS